MERERYFVQVSRVDDPLMAYAVGGWLTQNVFLDWAAAEQQAESYERAAIWVDGEDFSTRMVTVARVISATELLERDGPQALAAAEAATRMELQVRLSETTD
jgi:hypothetical protein